MPLFGRALNVVLRRKERFGDGWLFPAKRRDGKLTHSEQKAVQVAVYYHQPYSTTRPELERARLPVTHWAPHDLRRSARTLLAAMGCPGDVAESVLGRMIPGVAGVYNRHQYDEQRVEWLRRLAFYQKRLSRCQKGSKRRAHVKQHVARLHEKIGNSRTDTMHKFSTSMVQRFDVIYIEDLNLRGMLKNHSLARALSDASIGQAARMLEEKAERYGKRVERIDRWYPSSKTCSACGHIQESMPLSVRDWTCPSCDTRHDRDMNAAVNIMAVGQTVSAHGGTVRRSRATASERKSPRSANRQAAASG